MDDYTDKILYIEDDEANRVLVRKLLTASGYEVLLAEDGVSGIDLACSSQPSLILMDMNMPGLDGYETSTRIKSIKSLQNVPVIAITANVVDGDRDRSLVAGCDGYIPKPLDPDNFVEEVQKYLGGQRDQVVSSREAVLLREYNDRLVNKLEEKVRELSVELDDSKRSDRLKYNFLSMMKHELRTPLNAIMNYPNMLLEQCVDVLSDEHKKWLLEINKNGKELYEVVNSIFEYIHLEESLSSSSLEPVVFYDVAHVCINRFRPAAEAKGLSLISGVDPDIPLIYTNSKNMQKVLSILIGNAIKFTNRGGVTLNCKQLDLESDALPDNVRTNLDGGIAYLLLTVSDTGIGIAADDHEKIFEEFTQVEDTITRHHGGIGIGLPLARRFVEYYHGRIWLESALGEGSHFHMLLPIKPI